MHTLADYSKHKLLTQLTVLSALILKQDQLQWVIYLKMRRMVKQYLLDFFIFAKLNLINPHI